VTPSEKAKAVGLKSLTQVSELTGTSLQTLINWERDKPKLFDIVLIGCKYKREGISENREAG
jgi:hypothetical protein